MAQHLLGAPLRCQLLCFSKRLHLTFFKKLVHQYRLRINVFLGGLLSSQTVCRYLWHCILLLSPSSPGAAHLHPVCSSHPPWSLERHTCFMQTANSWLWFCFPFSLMIITVWIGAFSPVLFNIDIDVCGLNWLHKCVLPITSHLRFLLLSSFWMFPCYLFW